MDGKTGYPEVTKSGVCNTILKREDNWYAFNLDFLAMANLLRPYRDRLKEGVLVIGTGATTRTSIAVLKDFGIDSIFITGRNEKRGLELSRIFSISFLKMDQLNGEKISGMIQTTPVGMYPDINQCPEAVKFLKPGQVVMDVIHNPAKTAFLKTAENLGCTIISGRDMFLNQAWRQFQVFRLIGKRGIDMLAPEFLQNFQVPVSELHRGFDYRALAPVVPGHDLDPRGMVLDRRLPFPRHAAVPGLQWD